MKVEVNSQALADAVAWTTRVIDARPASPILAGIRLEAIDGTLQLSAFNYAISARHHIEAGVDESGSILVLGKLLADITKSLPAAKTYLSTDGSTLTITSGKSTFTMQLMPDNEYPDLPVVPAKLGQVDARTFAQAVAQASVAVSREENRPVLTGIRVQFQGNKVIMSSTDRFRLSRSSFTWTPENPDINTTALVRGALLRDVARSLDEHQNIVVDFDPENPSLLGFENAGRVSASQLIDGEFPAVDRLYADEYPIHAVINKQDLISARNQADGLIYGTEKSIKDLGDKLDAALKSDIEGKIASLKTLMESEDVEAIKKATEELAQASHKLAEQLYQQQQAGGAGAQPGADAAGAAGAQPGAGAAGGKKADDDVIDADFTESK